MSSAPDESAAPPSAGPTPGPADPYAVTPTVATPDPGTPGAAEARYVVVRHVASGGMGDVYEAHDRELNRRVALKKLGVGLAASAEGAERFRREALAAAQLDHPHIVPVYDAGRHDGRPFFTMAFVDGESLAARVRARGPLPPAEAVRLMLPVVEAVGYAHARHLVHRDLKPENVLVDAAGRPRVTDFGLARYLLEPGNLTDPAQLLGTPRYMAPEQAHPAVGPVGPATDVYALGGVLVFLLTGESPIAGETLPEVLLNVLDGPPLLPVDRRDDVPAALNEVCRRCLAKDPADRYPSAAALHDALTPVAAGEPDAPPPARPRSRLRAALAALVVLLTAAVVAIVAGQSARRDPPESAGGSPAPPAPTSVPPGVDTAVQPATPPAKADPPPARGNPVLYALAGHSGRVWASFAPDGRSLVSWGDDATLRVWDATTGKAAKSLLREKTATTALRWAPDGKSAAVALASGTARVYALPGWGERVVYTDAASGVSAVAYSPDGGRLAVGTDGGGLKVFDTATWAERADCAGHSDRVLAGGLFFTPDGARLVSASRDATVRVWDAATGAKVRSVPAPADLTAVLPTPDPDRVVEVDRGFGARNVSVRDLRTGGTAARFAKQGSATAALTLAPDGRHLWDATDGDCVVWDLTTLKEAGRVPGLSGVAFAFVPGTPWLLAAAESRLGVFRVNGTRAVRVRGVEGHAKPIVSLAVSPDGRLAATGDEDGTIKVWDVAALTRP